MQEIGLMPSNTGQPGGGKTGQQMTHYVIEDGPFALSRCRPAGAGLVNPIPRPVWTFPCGTWTSSGAGEGW